MPCYIAGNQAVVHTFAQFAKTCDCGETMTPARGAAGHPAGPCMIPPRPWHIAVPQPPWSKARVYVVDAQGHQVFDVSMARDLAEYVVQLANAAEGATP